VSAGLPLTQLELTTLAIVCCALATYGFWWYKPFGVERGTTVLCPVSRRNEVISKLDLRDRRERVSNTSTYETEYFLVGIAFHTPELYKYMPSFALYVAGTVLSALHIAAWNWEFPSSTLRTLWRIFGVAATGAAITPLASIYFYKFLKSVLRLHVSSLLLSPPTVASVIVYITSRLSLIVLTFYCFSSMPASVYETVDWTNFLPHFS
jgi:hypothetical protein